MACDRCDDRLWQLLQIEIISKLLSGCATIHHGHVTIHQDEVVTIVAIFFHVFYYFLKSLVTIHCFFDFLCDILDFEVVFKNNLDGIDIKLFVVNYQYFHLLSILFVTFWFALLFQIS
jgi:hypothetical protein